MTLGEPPLLSLSGLRRSFGGVQAVRNVSFDVVDSRITGLIGPNGAGKSTVLNMIAGATKPNAGSIRFLGDEIAGKPAFKVARRGIIRTFQTAAEFHHLSVIENLLVASPSPRGERLLTAVFCRRWWRRYEEEMIERARELLRAFEIAAKEDELAGSLSGGQKRLLELARSLMPAPRLLLLDEPMAGVNPALVRRIEEHLVRLCDEGVTMLLIEHELSVVERLCDTVIVMAQGEVLSSGTMADLRRNQEVLDAYLVG